MTVSPPTAPPAPVFPSGRRTSSRRTPDGPVLNLEKYIPGLLTLIASNMSGGASTAYLALYAVGIETWRVMVMLAIEKRVTAQRIVQLLDADKGAISRTFKSMHEQDLIRFEPDEHDGRLKHAVFTPRGRALHDRILRLALVREEAAVACLDDKELDTLRTLLHRVYANLQNVERVTYGFSQSERRVLGMHTDAPALRRRGSIKSKAHTSANAPLPVLAAPVKKPTAARKNAARR